ncbi:MAG: hypothetical protein GY820_19290 [Gammaproteobacteria bacterium]|nr:hypothetical protein [Gammaproteobacteria bacterium]
MTNIVTAKGSSKRRWFVGLLIGFVASVAAMGVIWVNSLPKITITDDNLSISNCELPLPTYAIGVCPKLYCKKAILGSGQFPLSSHIGFNDPKPSGKQILGGAIRYHEEGNAELITKRFECELEGYDVKGLAFPS